MPYYLEKKGIFVNFIGNEKDQYSLKKINYYSSSLFIISLFKMRLL